MAYKFVNADQLDADLTTVANAIRTKGKTTAQLAFPSGMVSAISAISTGAELNFEIVGGTSAPSSPKENTIWVNTSTSVTGYYFSAEQPQSPVSGNVWIVTGDSSDVAFNALKSNGIQVYPLMVQQYVSGSWVNKEAKTRKNNAWVAWWSGSLYEAGNEYTNVTGGWIIINQGTKNASSIRIGSTSTSNNSSILQTSSAIDFAKYGFAKIEAHFTYFETSASNGALKFYLVNEAGSVVTQASWTDNKSSNFTLSINVPANSGKCFVRLETGHGANTRYTYADLSYARAVK